MYVTRPLARYLADPKAAEEPLPEGPGSGILVVVDETRETASTRCCGCCVDREMRSLPFPQNRQLALRENSTPDALESCATCVEITSGILECCLALASGGGGGRAPGAGKAAKLPHYAMLLPVVGHPLSSGRYYVVRADGRHMGKVSACSKEEDKTKCCIGSCVNDVKPRIFDHGDMYQQVDVQRRHPSRDRGFKAVAVATDGIPPDYLRKKGWKVNTMAYPEYKLTDDAQGVDLALRHRMPDLDGLGIVERRSPPVVVGKWYVPFMFVKGDGMFVKAEGCCFKGEVKFSLKEQCDKCMFYNMTMEQSWEQIYNLEATDGTHHERNEPTEVAVTAMVRRSTAVLDGTSVVPQEESGTVWFRPAADTMAAVGLDIVVWERMKWELERGGWVAPDNGDEERIDRVERRDGQGHWRKFGCYVLVERFVLKRMDGSLALTCEFRHTDKIKAKWI